MRGGVVFCPDQAIVIAGVYSGEECGVIDDTLIWFGAVWIARYLDMFNPRQACVEYRHDVCGIDDATGVVGLAL